MKGIARFLPQSPSGAITKEHGTPRRMKGEIINPRIGKPGLQGDVRVNGKFASPKVPMPQYVAGIASDPLHLRGVDGRELHKSKELRSLHQQARDRGQLIAGKQLSPEEAAKWAMILRKL